MENRKLLKIGKKYEFNFDGAVISYEIKKCIGYGGNSIVYEVRCNDYEIGRLKEFYPVDIKIERDDDDNIVVVEDKDEIEKFETRKKDFIQILQKRALLIGLNSQIAATMPEYCQLISGRNTMYIFQSYTYGKCYSDVKNETLKEIIKTTISLVKSLKCYHDIGFVHLDIKPENILVIDNANDLRIQLFDYETVSKIEDLRNGKIQNIPYSENYSSPEQVKNECKKIDISSDIYSVGIIFFSKVMGRFPKRENFELSCGAQYNYDMDSNLFKNIPQTIQKVLDELFAHTIRDYKYLRYQTDDELLDVLGKLLSFTVNNHYVIQKKNYRIATDTLFGRENELQQIDFCLKNNSLLLIYGMGGIGKSKLVKTYLSENEEYYEKIIYIDDTGNSIRDAVISDDNIEINGIWHIDGLSDDDYFNVKLEILRRECESLRTNGKDGMLIVFDNVEYFNNLKYLFKLIEIGCKVIIVSRDPWRDVECFEQKIEIGRLKNKQEEMRLFLSELEESDFDSFEIDAIHRIIDRYEGHLLLIVLIAKAINASGKMPSQILRHIENDGIAASGDEEIRFVSNGIIKQEFIEDLVYGFFDASNASDEELEVLQFMSLIPVGGIKKLDVKQFIYSKKAFDQLISTGFIHYVSGRYSMHPIIKEMIEKKHPVGGTAKNDYAKKMIEFYRENRERIDYDKAHLIREIGRSLDNLGGITEKSFFKILGKVNQILGYYANSKRYYEKEIQLTLNEYGKNSIQVADDYIEFCAKMRMYYSEYIECKEYLERAISILEKQEKIATSDNVIDIRIRKAVAYNQLGILYRSIGECELALDYGRKAYNIGKLCRTESRRSEIIFASFVEALGGTLYECGLFNDAIEYYQEANRIIGGGRSIYSLRGLARCEYMMENFKSAKDYIDMAMEILDSASGIEGIESAKTYYFAAQICEALQMNKEAEMYYSQAQKLEETFLGKNNNFTILVIVDFIYFQWKNKKHLLSLEKYEEVKKLIDSKERPKTASFREMYRKMEEITNAIGLKWNPEY